VQSDKGNKNFGKPKQFLMPRHMCQSILFEKGEDYYYDQYLSSGNSPKWPNDDKDWRDRIAKWCGPNSGVKWTIGANNTKGLYGLSVPSKSEWFETDKNGVLLHSDNIFARYSINYDSPLVYSLCNRHVTATASGLSFEYSACMALMGYTDTSEPLQTEGGWIGFLKKFKSSDISPQDFLYTRLTLANNPVNDEGADGPLPCPPGKKSGAVQGALVQGGMMGMMAGPMLWAGATLLAVPTGGLSYVAAAAGTAAVAGGVSYMDYNSKTDGSNCT
jgi:hypothetical protein